MQANLDSQNACTEPSKPYTGLDYMTGFMSFTTCQTCLKFLKRLKQPLSQKPEQEISLVPGSKLSYDIFILELFISDGCGLLFCVFP